MNKSNKINVFIQVLPIKLRGTDTLIMYGGSEDPKKTTIQTNDVMLCF